MHKTLSVDQVARIFRDVQCGINVTAIHAIAVLLVILGILFCVANWAFLFLSYTRWTEELC